MQELLTLIVTWLAVNFGLPATDELPRVAFVPPAVMAEIRLDRSAPASGGGGAGEARAPAQPAHSEAAGALNAIYDDRSRTIYLPRRWTAASPADMSMLVHELVHHLQNAGGLTYACAEARERPAYQAQGRWLEMFGTTLPEEFALDAMTLHLRTRCMH